MLNKWTKSAGSRLAKVSSIMFKAQKERETGLEPATPTLARSCSTN